MDTLSLPRCGRWVWAAPLTVLVVAAATHGVMMLLPAPADLDLSTTRTSAMGTFVATVNPGELSLGSPMTWTFAVSNLKGEPIKAVDLAVDGGMPLHGHGLPSDPSAPVDGTEGVFEVSNIQFSMPGWWVVKLHRSTPLGDDTATFNFAM